MVQECPEPRYLADSTRRLLADALVNDCLVATGLLPGRTIAFIVPQGFRLGPLLRQRARERIPDVGRTLEVAVVGQIPRTPDGAPDWKMMHEALGAAGTVYGFEPPAGETERALAHLIAEVFPSIEVSMTDNLGDLGGDSLITLELSIRISERFGAEIDPHDLYRADSLRDIARLLANSSATSEMDGTPA
jgi:acyl carrier protein